MSLVDFEVGNASERVPPIPKYYRLKEHLRAQIEEMEIGAPLPSEAELCHTHGMSRTTVRKALNDLVQEGLVHRVQGKGTFVSPSKVQVRFIQRRAGFFEDMVSRGFKIRSSVLEQCLVQPPLQVKMHLDLTAGEQVVKLTRLRFINEAPILICTSYLPYSLFPALLEENLESRSLYMVMCEKYGVKITGGTSWVEAGIASKRDTDLLKIARGSPILIVTEVMQQHDGRPIEYGHARQRGDKTQIEIGVLME
jgi:GntR family transcriptional regulator